MLHRKLLLRISIPLCIMFFCQLNVAGDLNYKVGFNYTPYFYESEYQLNSTSMELNLMGGWNFNNTYSLGIDTDTEYGSMDGDELYGSWFLIRGGLNNSFRIGTTLELSVSLGGLWKKTSFNYRESGWYVQDQPGLAALLDITFSPIAFFHFRLYNELQLLFPDSRITGSAPLYPLYNAGGIIDISLSGNISFYADIAYLYWGYEAHFLSIRSHIFRAGLGITIHSGIPGKKKKTIPLLPVNPPPLIVENNVYVPQSTFLEKLYHARNGEVITIEKMAPETAPDYFLDEMAHIMKIREGVIISLAASTIFTGNPLKEMETCHERAEMFKELLVQRGVDSKQIKISTTALLIKADAPVQSKIRIKIIGTIPGSE